MTGPPPLVREYLAALRVDLLPIYIGLAGLSVWLGMLTVIVVTEAGVAASETVLLQRLAAVLGVTFGVLLPFGTPAVGVAARRVWGDGDE